MAAAREAVRLERAKLDAEQKKLANGLSTSYNLILAQRDLFIAELAEAQARDAFAKAGIAPRSGHRSHPRSQPHQPQ